MNTGQRRRRIRGERKRRRSYAEGAKGIPNLFEDALKQCLCGLQGINGWEGAWGLVVGGFCGFALRRLEGYGATTQKAQRLRRSRRRNCGFLNLLLREESISAFLYSKTDLNAIWITPFVQRRLDNGIGKAVFV